jgi:hypothetical protein
MPNRTHALTGLLLAATVGLGACNNDPGPTTDPLTAQNAQTVGAAAASTADLALGALNPAVPDFGGGFPLFFANGRSIGGGISFAPPDSLPNCPAASNLTDTDSDGVPDNATWTFSAANCTETDIEGNSSVVTGTVVISDPGLTAGYDLQLNHLTGAYYQNGETVPLLQLALDGVWALRGTSDALNLDQNYNFALTVQDERVTLANDLGVIFDATGGPIAWGAPLPDGTLAIDGDWDLASSRQNFALTLSTIAPLVYDDACSGIVGGTLEARERDSGGAVQITWTACGVHTSTFIED